MTRPQAKDFKEDFFFGQGGDRIYHIIVPVLGSNDQLIGKLRIGFDETPVDEHIKQTYCWGLLVGVGFIIVSLFFVFFFGHLLTRSVRQLRDAARRIANGNINERLDILPPISTKCRIWRVALEYMRGKLVFART